MTEQQVGTRFVGRERELDELVGMLREARSGRGHLALLGGEPGIGKSRLADELANRAREDGHLVLWGRGWEDAGAPPYWPWVQVLRAYLRTNPAADVRRHLGFGARDVVQILPELRELMPELEAPSDQVSESARFQLFDSTAALLRNAARDRPLLVVIDDLQAADTPSILLLRFLASQLLDMPVLIVGTYRDVELTPDHPLTAAIGEMSREPVTRLVQIGGLRPDAVDALIGATAKIAGRARLATAVWQATNGNPLFVGEAIRLLSAEGRLIDVADGAALHVAVPPGVRAVIARRVGHLREATARVLTVGAVIGPEFGLELLRRVAGEANAPDLVREAVQAGLLVEVSGTPSRYRFSHDLVRETLYEELIPGLRGRFHRQIAATLEELFAASTDAHLAELAFHSVQAVRHLDADEIATDVEILRAKAIDYAKRAGDHATRSLAYEEAIRLYRMALGVLDMAVAPDEAVRAETLLALGDVQARVSSLDEARMTFLEAAEIARRTGDGRQLARAALGVGGRLPWARPGKDTKLIPLLQDALVLLGGSDDRLRVFLLARLACAWRSSPERRHDSDALSRQAIDIARQTDDLGTLSYALAGRFWATWWPENPEERERLSTEIVAIATTLGDGERIIDAHLIRFLSLGELGRLAEARVELNALVRGIHELRQPAQSWLEHINRAYLDLAVGEFQQADELISRQLQHDDQYTPARDGLSAARMERFLVRREQGRVAEEESTVRASVDDFPWYPFHRAALAVLLLDAGREREARIVFDDFARDGFSAFYRDNEWLFGMSLASEACALLGDATAAAVIYEQLAPFAGRHAIAHAEGSVGAVDRYLGLLAATRGNLDSAVRHLQDAVSVNDAMGARPWTAHSLHDLAVVLRRRNARGDAEEADRRDEAARVLASELGMVLADEIEPPRDGGRASVAQASPTATTATFRRQGEYWTIEFGGEAAFRVRDSKGMHHLARLLAAPGREVHALELAGSEVSGGGERGPSERELAGTGFGDAGPILDPEAKAAYRARLVEIRDEVAEAERWNDPERLARLKEEEQALAHELAGALGLGGRDRVTGSATERGRVSVTRAIRAALARVREHSPALGDHLDATIRTGTFCAYLPDPRAPIDWRI